MSMYRFSKSGRLFVQGTREEDDRDNVAASSPGGTDLQAIYTKRRLSTEVLGSSIESTKTSKSGENGSRRIVTRIVRKTTTLTRGEEKSVAEDLTNHAQVKSLQAAQYTKVIQGSTQNSPKTKTVRISDIVVGQEPNVTAREALLQWARRTTSRYPGVRVSDFTGSWRDGLAFSAILHRNRPDLIDWRSARSFQARERLHQVFYVAEREYGVTRLLDPEDVDTPEPDEKSLITYISSLYDVFPQPPQIHPLYDADAQRRSGEYRELATSLHLWIREKIVIMQERAFPPTLIEMKKLAADNAKFKNEEVPVRYRDKQRLTHIFRDLQKYFEAMGEVDMEPELHIDVIDKNWNRLMMLHQEREGAVLDEIKRLERLQRLAEKVHREMKSTDNRLEELERRVEDEARRLDRLHPLEAKHAVDLLEQDIRNTEVQIQNIFTDVHTLTEGKYSQAAELHKRVQKLHHRWVALRSLLHKRLVTPLSAVSFPVEERVVTKHRTTVHETRLVDTNPHFRNLHDCIDWCKNKMKQLQEADYGSDLPSVKNELEIHQREHKNIDQFHSKIDKCVHAKNNFHGEELTLYNQHLSTLQKIYSELLTTSNKRLSDLDTLHDFIQSATGELVWLNAKEDTEVTRDWSDKNLNVQSIEQYYESLMSDLEKREFQFSAVQERGGALVLQHHPGAKTIEAYMSAMQSQWAWLLQLTLCLEVHLRHASESQQFFKEIQSSEQWISKRDEILNTIYSQSDFSLDEGERLLKGMQELREELNNYGDHIQRLVEQAKNIVPMKQRRQPVTRPLQVTCICEYKQVNMSIEKNEQCTLYDNSGRVKWRVKNSQGVESPVPGVCFALQPTDKDALDAAERLRRQYDRSVALWQRKQLRLRQNMIFATIKVVKGWDLPQFLAMGQDQRTAIRKALNEDAEKLLSEGDPADPQLRRLRREIADVNRLFDDFEKRARAEEESKNAGRIFTDQVSSLQQALDEAERILNIRIASPLPRDLDSLEHLVLEHKDYEQNLKRLAPDYEQVQQTFRGITLKTPAMRNKLDNVMSKWSHLWNLSNLYIERLKCIEIVLSGLEENTVAISEFEVKLASYSELPSDVKGLQIVLEDLMILQNAIGQQQVSIDQLNDDAHNARKLVEKSRPQHRGPHGDMDRLDAEVNRLNARWTNICGQLADRLRSAETAYTLAQKYHNSFQSEVDFVDESFGKLEAVSPVHNMAQELEATKNLLNRVCDRAPAIEAVNVTGGRLIREGKIYAQRLRAFKEQLEELCPSLDASVKRQRRESVTTVDNVVHDLDNLNRRYTTLVSLCRERVQKLVQQYPDDLALQRALQEQRPLRTFRTEFNIYESTTSEERYTSTTTHYTQSQFSSERHESSATTISSEIGQISSRESSPLKRPHENNHTDLSFATNGDKGFEVPDGTHIHKTTSNSMQFSEIKSIKRTHRSDDFDTDNIIEARGIVHPKTGEILTVGEAISLRILDVRNGRISTSIDGKTSISIEEATRLNLIDPELANRLLGPCGVVENGRRLSLLEAIQRELFDAERGDDRVKVTCVTSGVSVADAMNRGILDPETGQFVTEDNEKISIEEAYNRGYLVRINTTVKIKRGALALADAISQSLVDDRGLIIDRNTGESYLLDESIERGIIDPDIREIVDVKNDIKITIAEAINQGIINPKSGRYIHGISMEKLTFREAKRRQLIIKPMTLKDCVDLEIIDAKGKISSPAHKMKLAILEAVTVGVLDADTVKSVSDTRTGDLLTLSDALASGVITAAGRYRDHANREELSIAEAVERGLITSVAQKSIFDIDGFKDPISGEFISLNAALLKGLISPKFGGSYVIDLKIGKTVAFTDAIEQGHARPEIMEMLNRGIGVTENGREVSVLEAVLLGLLDPKSGQLLDPRTKKTVPLEEAIKRGLITPDGAALLASLLNITVTTQTVTKTIKRYITVTETGETVTRDYKISYKEALSRGFINEKTREFNDPDSGKRIPVQEAISQGLISNPESHEAERPSPRKTRDSPSKQMFFESTLYARVNDQTQPPRPISPPRAIGTITTVISHEVVPPRNSELNIGTVSISSPKLSSRSPSPTKQSRKVDKHISTVVLSPTNDSPNDISRACTNLIENESSSDEKQVFELPSDGWMLSDAIQKKIFDPVTGLFIIPGTDRLVSFEECVKLEIINPNSGVVIDPKNGRKVSLLRSLEKNILDSTGHYIHPQKISMKEAINKGFVILEPTPMEVDHVNPRLFEITKISGEPDKVQVTNVNDPTRDVELAGSGGQFTSDPIQVTQGVIYDPATALLIFTESGKSENILAAVNDGTLESASVIVKDPKTGKEITLKQAVDKKILDPKTGIYVDDTGRKISLSDAAKFGLVAVLGTPLVAAAAAVEAVKKAMIKDPKTGETIPREVAVERGLVTADEIVSQSEIMTTKVFLKDPKTGEEIAANEALEKGLITPDEMKKSIIKSDSSVTVKIVQSSKLSFDDEKDMGPSLAEMTRDRVTTEPKYQVTIGRASSVSQSPERDAKHIILQKMGKKLVNPKEAVESGLIDKTTADLLAPTVDKINQESLTHALKTHKIDPSKGKIIDPQRGDILTIEQALDRGVLDIESANILVPLAKSLSVSGLYNQGLLNREGNVIHPETGDELTLDQAIVCEIVDSHSKIIDGSSPPITIASAIEKGMIDSEKSIIQTSKGDLNLVEATEQNIFRFAEGKNPISLPPVGMTFPVALKRGLIDPVKKQVIHPLTREHFPIDVAIEKEFFMSQSYAPAPDNIEVTKAIDDGLIDAEKLIFIQPVTGKSIPISEAFESGVLVLKAQPEIDKLLRTVTETITSYHTITTKTVELSPGYILLNSTAVQNINTGEVIPMSEAQDKGIVKNESEKKEQFTTRENEIMFPEAVEKGLVDMKAGTFTDPDTGNTIPISEAIENGILDTSNVSTTHSPSKINTSMTVLEAVNQIYDDKTEKFHDPTTNISYDFIEAVDAGLIDSDSIVYDVKSSLPLTPREAIEQGILDPKTGKMKDSRGNSISVSQATKLGLLAVVAAPVLAGKVIVDAIKNKKTSDKKQVMFQHEAVQKSTEMPSSTPIVKSHEREEQMEVFEDDEVSISYPIQTTLDEAINDNLIDTQNCRIIIGDKELPLSVQNALENKEISLNEMVIVLSKVTIRILEERPRFRIEITRNLTAESLAEQGVYDMSSEKYLNPYTGNTIGFHDFVLDLEIFDPDNVWVRDPSSKTEEYVPLREAINRPLVDRNIGYMVDPKSGKKIPFLEAVKLGLIVQRSSIEDETLVLTLQEAVESGICDSMTGALQDPRSGEQLSLADAVGTGLIDVDSVSIRNPVNDEIIPLSEAVDAGVVDLNRGVIINIETRKEIDIRVGFVEGLVLPGVRKPISLEAVIKTGLYEPESGKIQDPLTRQSIDIEEGIRRGIVDAFITECQDTKSGTFVSLEDAISSKLVDPQTGLIHDTKAGESYPLDKALAKKLIITTPFVPSFIDVIIQEYYSPKTGLVLNPMTGEETTMKQALITGYIDGKTIKIKDERKDKVISLKEAEKIGFLDLEKGILNYPHRMTLDVALEKGYILNTIKPWTLQEALAHQSYYPVTGTFVIEGERLTLEKAIARGFIRSDSPSIKDPRTGEVITLADAIKLGLIDTKTGTALDPSTGTALALTDAMDRGLVVPAKRKISLPDAVFKGFYDPKTGHFTSLETREWLPTDRAIKAGVIDPTSAIVKNPQGELMTFSKAIEEKIVNPKTGTVTTNSGQAIDFQEAFEEGVLLETRRPMSFSEAMLKGILDKKTGLFLDPKSGAYLTVAQAIERNVIDAESVTVKDAKTGFSKKITLAEAIKLGIIDGKVGKIEDFTRNNIYISLKEAYEIGLIVDNKAAISVQRAIHQGLYDDKTGKIIDPSTGRAITLHEAMRMCVISPKLVCYWDKRGESLLSLAQTCRIGVIDRRSGMFKEPGAHSSIPLSMALQLGLIIDIESGGFGLYEAVHMGMYDIPSGQFIHPTTNKNLTLSEACQVEMINPLVSIVKDTKTNKYILLSDAVTRGIVDEIRGTYTIVDLDKVINLQEAKQKGYIVPSTNPLSIDEAVKSGLYRGESGKFVNPMLNELLDLVQAFNSGLIDPETTALKDATTGQIKSLQEGIADGTIDVSKGHVLDPKTKRAYNIDIALERGLLVNIDKPLSHKSEQRTTFEIRMNPVANRGIRECSIEEAIQYELLDSKKSLVKDPRTGKFISLSKGLEDDVIDSSKRGTIVPQTGKIPQQCIRFEDVNIFLSEPLTFEVAVEKNYLNLETAILTDPKSKEEVNLKEAISLGIIDSDSALIKDVQKKKLVKLPEAFRKGIMDGEKGNVLDTETSKLYTLPKAVEIGLLTTQKYGISFIETLEFGLYNPTTGGFNDPFVVTSVLDRKRLTLSEVLESGLVDPSTTVVKDPVTGNISSLLEAINEKKIDPVGGRLLNDPDDKDLDFVKALERGFILAAEARVSDRIEVLMSIKLAKQVTVLMHFLNYPFCFEIFFLHITFFSLPLYNGVTGFSLIIFFILT